MTDLKGFRAWFEALGDAARLMVTRDPFVGEIERSATLAQQRAEDHARVSALAGLTPDGAIAPPPPGIRINRDASPMWRVRSPTTPEPILPKTSAGPTQTLWHDSGDTEARCTVEGLISQRRSSC